MTPCLPAIFVEFAASRGLVHLLEDVIFTYKASKKRPATFVQNLKKTQKMFLLINKQRKSCVSKAFKCEHQFAVRCVREEIHRNGINGHQR